MKSTIVAFVIISVAMLIAYIDYVLSLSRLCSLTPLSERDLLGSIFSYLSLFFKSFCNKCC